MTGAAAMTERALRGALEEAVGKGRLRAAGPADTVGGVTATFVARPADTADVAAVLRVASAAGLAVVARGAGTRLDWGSAPEQADLIVEVGDLSGIVEHVAGDLVVVVRAGTVLADLNDALAPSGQRLAIDGQWPGATVGGLVAQGLSGPSRMGYGTLRDLLIGVTFVRADGVVARSGGKVVKNVAGYDLGKLLHGSWGTLGILTELVFRLHPLPPARRWITVAVESPEEIGQLTQRILQSQVVPVALELDRPPRGPDHLGEPSHLGVLVEGPVATLDRRAARVADLLGGSPGAVVRAEEPAWWGRRPSAPGDLLVRATTELASLPALIAAIDALALRTELALHLRGSAGVGSLLIGIPGRPDIVGLRAVIEGLRATATEWGGTVVVHDGPQDLRASLDSWGPVAALELMRRVKERFDPARTLAPGRFVGGI